MDRTSNIRLGDIELDVLCDECKGAGSYYNTAYQRWVDGGEKGEEPLDYLWCDECEGIGHVPTEGGRAILMLVRRYAKQ